MVMSMELCARRRSWRGGARRVSWRASERGAAIFMVLLVIAVLTSLGLFAGHVAGLNQRISGYGWQSTLSEYAADMGTLAVASELSTEAASGYMQMVFAGEEDCTANQYLDETVGTLPCYRLTKADIQRRLAGEGEAQSLFDATATAVGGQYLTGDFVIELTDPGPSTRPIPGMDQGGTGPRFRYMQLTLTGIGRIRPVSGQNEEVVSSTAAIRSNRAVVQVGPLPY